MILDCWYGTVEIYASSLFHGCKLVGFVLQFFFHISNLCNPLSCLLQESSKWFEAPVSVPILGPILLCWLSNSVRYADSRKMQLYIFFVLWFLLLYLVLWTSIIILLCCSYCSFSFFWRMLCHAMFSILSWHLHFLYFFSRTMLIFFSLS